MRFPNKRPTPTSRATAPVRSMLWTLTAVALCGCDKSHELETAKVSGKVLLDGKPMTLGTVMFVPEKGRAGNGVIGPDGAYRLTTYKPDDGALVGRHKIAVAIPEGSETPSKPIATAIPRRYMSAESSGLSFDVKAGEENQVDLALSSTPP